MSAFYTKRKYEQLAFVVHVPQNTQMVIWRCGFAEDSSEIYKDLKRTCISIVLPIKPYVLLRSRCRRRRGLLNWIDQSAFNRREKLYSPYVNAC